jgi:Tfp pilus assembly protein PilP
MWKSVALLALLLLLSGCMTYKTVKTEQLTDFKQKVRSEHKEITDLKIQMSPPKVEFKYYLDRETDKEADEDIFVKTKELVLSQDFQKTAIEEFYFKNYSEVDRRYPDILIRFYGTQQDKADYQYTSSYYGAGVEGA